MGFRGMRGLINAPDETPRITWPLLMRVLRYARPYRWLMVAMLALILASTGLSLLSPLIMRDLIDRTIPSGTCGAWVFWRAHCSCCRPSTAG